MTLRTDIFIALLFVPFVAIQAAETPKVYSKPNILLILADDMGWGDLRCHGNDKIDTPSLDKLQSQSVELDRFFVSPLCSPTRSSLLTGRHHLRLGVLSTTGGLEVIRGEEVTIAEGLHSAGYSTGCFGKWHNGSNHPSTARGQGFNEFFGFSGGFFSNYFDPELEHDGVTAIRKGFITDVIADKAIDFIERNQSHPFFCYVPFNACHSPMQAPEGLFTKYRNHGFEPKEAAVYAMVENLDTNVGRLLAKLDATGLARNNIVLFASDNGPNTVRFNGGMRGIKGNIFEGGIRVPCFIRWPGKLEAGKIIQHIAQHVDLFPTLLDLVDVPLPMSRPLDGISLAPLLRGTIDAWPDRKLFDLSGRSGNDGATIAKFPGTVRTPTHRWVHDGKQVFLFDHRNDPGETQNIATQQLELEVELAKAYENWFRDATASSDGLIQHFPITLTENTALLVSSAAFQGNARSFGKGWDNDWAIGFDGPGDSISWNLDLPQAATYEVSILHTAKKAGGSIEVRVGSNRIRSEVSKVYDPPEIPRPDLVTRWEVPDKIFQPLTIGPISIPNGRHEFKLTASPGVEIQAVRLTRSDSKKDSK